MAPDSRLPSQRIESALAIVAGIRAEAARRGLDGKSGFDMKVFTDEMWTADVPRRLRPGGEGGEFAQTDLA